MVATTVPAGCSKGWPAVFDVVRDECAMVTNSLSSQVCQHSLKLLIVLISVDAQSVEPMKYYYSL